MRQVFEFGEFRFEPAIPLLTRNCRSLEIAPKALKILAVLVRNAGQVISKDDLLQIVWPGTVVEEGNLAVYIFALRKALAEHGDGGNYIETIPKRGYRFAGSIRRALAPTRSEFADGVANLCEIGDHYLSQQTLNGCHKAEAVYKSVLAKDPNSVKARTGLADSLLLRFILGDVNRGEGALQAGAVLAEASRIDSTCAEVHLGLSRWHGICNWDWDKAEEHSLRALDSAIENTQRQFVRAWYGSLLVRRGRIEQGLRELGRASAAYPLSPIIWSLLADAHFMARGFGASVAKSREGLQLHPNCWLLYRALAKGLATLGDYTGALSAFRRAMQFDGSPKLHLLTDIAYAHAAAGRRDDALKLILQIGASGECAPSLIEVARVHAVLGEKNRALDCIEEAYTRRDSYVSVLKQDSRLDPLRTDFRYRSIVAKIGI